MTPPLLFRNCHCSRSAVTLVIVLTILAYFPTSQASAQGIPPIRIIKPSVTGDAAISPDGKWLAVSGDNGTCVATTFYDTTTWRERRPLMLQKFEAQTNNTKLLAWSADSRHVITAIPNGPGYGGFLVISAPSFKLQKAWAPPGIDNSLQWDGVRTVPGTTWFASFCGTDKELRIRNFETGRTIFSVPTPIDYIGAVDVASDGSYIVVGDGNTVLLVGVNARKVITSAKLPGAIFAVACSPNNDRIAVIFRDDKNVLGRGGDAMWLRFLSFTDLARVGPQAIVDYDPGANNTAVCYSADGRLLLLADDASADKNGNPMSTVSVLRTLDLSQMCTLGPVPGSNTELTCPTDGKLVLMNTDSAVAMWSRDQFEPNLARGASRLVVQVDPSVSVAKAGDEYADSLVVSAAGRARTVRISAKIKASDGKPAPTGLTIAFARSSATVKSKGQDIEFDYKVKATSSVPSGSYTADIVASCGRAIARATETIQVSDVLLSVNDEGYTPVRPNVGQKFTDKLDASMSPMPGGDVSYLWTLGPVWFSKTDSPHSYVVATPSVCKVGWASGSDGTGQHAMFSGAFEAVGFYSIKATCTVRYGLKTVTSSTYIGGLPSCAN